MNLTFEGCGTEAQIKLLTLATNYFASELLSRKITNHMTVNIIVRSNIREHGLCVPVGFNTKNIARDFDIEIRKKKSIKSMISTLAHEMVHVKQYALGEMCELGSHWKGRKVDTRKTGYYDLPWEIEAFEKEATLYKKFVEKYGKPKIHEHRVHMGI